MYDVLPEFWIIMTIMVIKIERAILKISYLIFLIHWGKMSDGLHNLSWLEKFIFGRKATIDYVDFANIVSSSSYSISFTLYYNFILFFKI